MSWPSRLQCTQYLGPLISIATNALAQPSPMYTVPRPTRLYCNQCLGPAVSNVHSTSAHPSLLQRIPRPSRLQCTQYLGPLVSITTNASAQPSPMYTVPRPTRPYCNQCLGPAASNVHSTSAHTLPRPIRLHRFLYSLLIIYIPILPSMLYPSGPPLSIGYTYTRPTPYLMLQLYRPTRLYCISGLGPSLSILPYSWAHPSLSYTLSTINYHCYIEYNLYYLLYSIPLAQPFPSGTHHTLGPLLYNGTIITFGPCRMARPSGYIVTLGWPSETGEFTEWAPFLW